MRASAIQFVILGMFASLSGAQQFRFPRVCDFSAVDITKTSATLRAKVEDDGGGLAGTSSATAPMVLVKSTTRVGQGRSRPARSSARR